MKADQYVDFFIFFLLQLSRNVEKELFESTIECCLKKKLFSEEQSSECNFSSVMSITLESLLK